MRQLHQRIGQTRLLRRQCGAVALAVSVLLLLLASAGTFYVTRTASVDQRVAGNAMRAKAAFEAADAGLNVALSFMDVDSRDLNGNGTSDSTLANLGRRRELI